jgi:hypothetical protein
MLLIGEIRTLFVLSSPDSTRMGEGREKFRLDVVLEGELTERWGGDRMDSTLGTAGISGIALLRPMITVSASGEIVRTGPELIPELDADDLQDWRFTNTPP